MASRLRRPPARTKDATNPDQLADALASRLKITASRRQKPQAAAAAAAAAPSPKDARTESMRAVNGAMQALTALAQAGWKKGASESTSTWRARNAEANTLAVGSKEHLAALRSVDGATVEIERAALSIVGKLVVLEMYDAAREILKEMRASLCKVLDLQSLDLPQTKSGIISLPLPSQAIEDPVHLTMVSTYLIQALTTTCFTISSGEDIEDLARVITSPNNHCLLAWLPVLRGMQAKQVDSLLTRAYTALTKACANRPNATPVRTAPSRGKAAAASESSGKMSPHSIYLLRGYALRCLVSASPGTVGPDAFWDQLVRFTASFAKACAEGQEEAAGSDVIMSTFEGIVQSGEDRADASTFLDGTKFLSFCDYWISFAKRGGDIVVLDRITSLMKHIPSSSRKTPEPVEERKVQASTDPILEGTKLCGLFAHAVALVDKLTEASGASEADVLEALQTCDRTIRKSSAFPLLLLGKPDDEEFTKISGKVDRALERLRRCTYKLIESREASSELKSVASQLLKTCVDALQQLLTQTTDRDLITDTLTRAIDSLFVLGRTTLNISLPSSYIPAYDYLEDALKIIDAISCEGVDIPNYLRCISGAFYNIAGSLYQASRHGAAVPFLKQACAVGLRALETHRAAVPPSTPKGKEKAKQREDEWLQLEQQLYRRWELLAVCYLKNGDRKNSYDAFMKCILTFPYTTSNLASETDSRPVSEILGANASAAVKPLVSLLDRVSYVGACELLLPPEQVSLYGSLTPPSSKLDLRIVGIVLEYQYESLFPHRWKEGTRRVLVRLLQDMLQVYGTKDGIAGFLMPVRRARVLLRCLEFLYRDEEDTAAVAAQIGFKSVADLGGQLVDLMSKKDLGLDSRLSVYKLQYAVSARLWLANLAHRNAGDDLISVVNEHVEEANALLDALQAEVARQTPKSRRKSSMNGHVAKRSRSPRLSKIASSPKASRTTRQRVPAAPRKAPPTTRARTTATTRATSTRTAVSKAKAPVTPKANSRTALPPVITSVTRTPPRLSMEGRGLAPMPFDDFSKFHDLLMLTSRILGLLSLVLPRFQLLGYLRKLCQRQLGTSSEEFIIASLELAYEYAKLGRLKRAIVVFSTALEIVRSGDTSPEIGAFFLLRFSETLALVNDVPRSSSVYLEAFDHSERILGEHKGMSSVQKIQSRARRLELSAMACRVFALIQNAREDGTACLSSLLQSLRLWNRAIDTTTRLARSAAKPTDTSDQNPFDNSNASGGNASAEQSQSQIKPKVSAKSSTELQWRLLEGTIFVLLSLADAYLTRGSPREAEYFLKQVQTLSESAGLPVVESRALTRMVEVQLGMGRLEDAAKLLEEATAKLGERVALDNVDLQRLLARYNEHAEDQATAAELSVKALEMLHQLNGDFQRMDGYVMGLRRSLEGQEVGGDTIAPELLAAVLTRYIWLLRRSGKHDLDGLLETLCSLPSSSKIEAQKNSLMANLTLHNVYQRFQSDMFLNSLTESTIAIPMGMSSRSNAQRVLPIGDVLSALDSAEQYFQDSIVLTEKAGNVIHLRDGAVSLALIKAFQASLGKLEDLNATYAASLLDLSAAVTLRREMLEAIQQKLASLLPSDDFQWPRIVSDGSPTPANSKGSPKRRMMLLGDSDFESDDNQDDAYDEAVHAYWKSVQARYQAKLLDKDALRGSQTQSLPSNWTIIHVTLADDKSTLLLSRQECGQDAAEPLLFCVPLKGRRDNGTGDEEEHLSFDDALAEFNEIIRLSNESTKAAVHVKVDDVEARSNWWKNRHGLDVRLKELLENIEFCWLGAFKTILSPRANLTPEQLSNLRVQFDRVFQRNLHVKEKRPKSRAGHKKGASQSQGPSDVSLDDSMLRCFSTLSPKCRDEELEDLLYFILDLYQFHGVPVVAAEVDSMQAVVDLRSVLEEHSGRLQKAGKGKGRSRDTDSAEEHLFLVLDKNVQGLPWESLPSLRGRSVSRIPCVDFLHDRIAFASLRRQQLSLEDANDGTAVVNPRNGYFILNPGGDLKKTEGRFQPWVADMKKLGWDGVAGSPVTEHQFSEALKNKNIVVYFGHGGGEQYIRSHRIRGLPTCAATLLWGCSSGALKEMGDFDRIGTPYNYMLGGCPTLVANLWDVTDRDIDKFSLSVFDKIGLDGTLADRSSRGRSSTTIVTAVAKSREVCKLRYLTGAAPVVYGIPFRL